MKEKTRTLKNNINIDQPPSAHKYRPYLRLRRPGDDVTGTAAAAAIVP